MKPRALLHLVSVLVLSGCVSVTAIVQTPTPDLPLPDLTITGGHVSMVDSNGNCLPGFEFIVTILNEGDAPASNVVLIETGSGHQIQVGTLEALQSMTVSFPTVASNGVYTVIADPQSMIVESDESNNSISFVAPTPTPPAFCLPVQPDDATPRPVPPSTQAALVLDGLIYADMNNAQIWKINTGGQAMAVLQGAQAQFSPDGMQAIIESQGDLLLAEPMDNPGRNITNTPDRFELAPQWWKEQPSKLVFLSRGSNEAQEKGRDTTIAGYLSIANKDGSEYVVLEDIPSYTVPALSPDGTMIAYDRSGAPMLYEMGKGPRPFDPTIYGYQPRAATNFTSPSYSQFGRFLTWWVSDGDLDTNREFSLLVFDLQAQTYSVLHTYKPLAGTAGWIPNPIWNGNEGWIAYPTRGEVTLWDVWISRPDRSESYRLGLATNPIWSPDQEHLIFVQWPPHSDSYLAASTSMIEVSTWNTQSAVLPPGSMPLGWTHPAYLNINYFPMFTAPSDWLIYSNANPSYQIQYPPNAILDSYAERLTLRMPIQPNTQMMEKSITIETRPDTVDNCYAFSPWEGKTVLNGADLKFYGGKYWETGSDGGRFLLGNYAIYDRGSCYTIRLKMTALSTSSTLPAPTREEMDVEVLLNMISTFTIY